MIRILFPLIALLLVVWFVRSYRMGSRAQQKRLVASFFFVLFFAGVVFLTVTGRLHVIAAVVAAMLPFAKKALPLLRYIPLVRRWVKAKKAPESDQADAKTGSSGDASSYSSAMTRKQALDVLGLNDEASEQDVVVAHKRLMQKCHPDRGGNDYLAAQLNQAKDTLLS